MKKSKLKLTNDIDTLLRMQSDMTVEATLEHHEDDMEFVNFQNDVLEIIKMAKELNESGIIEIYK